MTATGGFYHLVVAAALACAAILSAGSARADAIGWSCAFESGASPLSWALIEHDVASGDIGIMANHLEVDDLSRSIAVRRSGNQVEYSHEVFRDDRLQHVDFYQIDMVSGAAMGIVELYDDEGNFIRGGPLSVSGHCTPSRALAPQPVNRDFGNATGICATQELGTQYVDRLRYCVSSVLPPQSGNSYGPENLFRNPQAAWCEGVPGQGEGERIIVETDPSILVHGVTINNGYQKSASSFSNNGRVRTIEIDAAGETRRFTLADSTEEQYLPFRVPLHTSFLVLRVIDTYPGARYADTCISGLDLDLEGY